MIKRNTKPGNREYDNENIRNFTVTFFYVFHQTLTLLVCSKLKQGGFHSLFIPVPILTFPAPKLSFGTEPLSIPEPVGG